MSNTYKTMDDADKFADFLKYGKLDNNNTYFSPVFLFSNDDMPLILENMDFDEGLLSVTASLDHALNAILLGARKITLFDINKAAKYFAELKKEAIKNLEYEEFLQLYGLETVKFSKFRRKNVKIVEGGKQVELNKDIVYKLCKDMSKPYSYFFERLFFLNFFDKDKRRISFHNNVIPNINSYLKKDEFYRLKGLLSEVEFDEYIDCNIFDLKKHIKDNEYSSMIFSNITSYFQNEDYKKFHILLEELKDNLTEDGLAQIGYGFIYTDYDEYGVKPMPASFVLDHFKNMTEEISKNYRITYFHKYDRYE